MICWEFISFIYMARLGKWAEVISFCWRADGSQQMGDDLEIEVFLLILESYSLDIGNHSSSYLFTYTSFFSSYSCYFFFYSSFAFRAYFLVLSL